MSRTREWRYCSHSKPASGQNAKNSSVRRTDALGSFWRLGDLESYKAKAGGPDTGCPPLLGAVLCYQATALQEPRNDPAAPLSLTGSPVHRSRDLAALPDEEPLGYEINAMEER